LSKTKQKEKKKSKNITNHEHPRWCPKEMLEPIYIRHHMLLSVKKFSFIILSVIEFYSSIFHLLS